MKRNLSENIRIHRKTRRLTQEQLAEALGVTVGAVSKWESGSSTPELGLIVELARFFETSVDVLVGYEWPAGGPSAAIESIRAKYKRKEHAAARADAEQALVKYPNNFNVVYCCAECFFVGGVDESDRASLRRALELFERSIQLLSQNTDPKIGELSIQEQIADVCVALGNTDKAIEILKAHNVGNRNAGSIGRFLASDKRNSEAAFPYLAQAMADLLQQIIHISLGFANAYACKEDTASAREIMGWAIGCLAGLRRPGPPTYLDMMELTLLCGTVQCYATEGDWDNVRVTLRRVAALAQSYDADPSYSTERIPFCCLDDRPTFFFDSLCQTALDSAEQMLHLGDDEETIAKALAIWQEVLAEGCTTNG